MWWIMPPKLSDSKSYRTLRAEKAAEKEKTKRDAKNGITTDLRRRSLPLEREIVHGSVKGSIILE